MSDNEDKIHIDAFAEIIAEKNGISREKAKDFIHIMFGEIGDTLVYEDAVQIHQFGTFKKKWTTERNGINPQTKEKIKIPPHFRILFTPASKLSSLVNKKYRNLTPNVLDELLTLTGLTKVDPDFLNAVKKDEEQQKKWQKAKKRALLLFAVFLVVVIGLLATLITIPVIAINENNKVVRYVNRINKIFGLNKITDKLRGTIDDREAETFFKEAQVQLTKERKIIDTYTVQDGDTIYGIAKHYWDNEYLWPDLYILNKTNLSDPDLIHKGDTLVIYEKLGDPATFKKKEIDNIVQAYIGIYRIYKALGEKELEKGRKRKGTQRIIDSRWTLYTAVRYEHRLLNKYKDVIYEEDSVYVQKLIDNFGFIPEKEESR